MADQQPVQGQFVQAMAAAQAQAAAGQPMPGQQMPLPTVETLAGQVISTQ